MPQNDFLLLSDGIPAGSSRRDGEALAVAPQPRTVTPAEGTELGAERDHAGRPALTPAPSTKSSLAALGAELVMGHSSEDSTAVRPRGREMQLEASKAQEQAAARGGQHGLQAAAETSHFAPALHSSTSLPKWILAKFKLQCSRFFQCSGKKKSSSQAEQNISFYPTQSTLLFLPGL